MLLERPGTDMIRGQPASKPMPPAVGRSFTVTRLSVELDGKFDLDLAPRSISTVAIRSEHLCAPRTSRPSTVPSIQHAFAAGARHRLRLMDHYARGDLSRTARVLQGQKPDLQEAVPAEVFLSVHLRVL